MLRRHLIWTLQWLVCSFFLSATAVQSQEIPDAVLDIFDNSCVACHEGASAARGLDLSEEAIAASIVNVESRDLPSFMLVKPGDSRRSYLIAKIIGSSRIKGKQMPYGEEPLSDAEIKTISDWIDSMPASTPAARKSTTVNAFPGMSIGNLPTTKTLGTGAFMYRIAHRFVGDIGDAGIDQLFGLDNGAFMMTQLAFPLSNNLNVIGARSAINATYELGAKFRILQQKQDGPPMSAAVYAGFDWASTKNVLDPENAGENLGRFAGERFSWFAQAPLSAQFGEKLSLLVVPGVLINGNVGVAEEDPLVSVGIGGRVALNRTYALFAEATPIVSGDETATPLGGYSSKDGNQVFYDTFIAGLEIAVGGHVFHLFVTNSVGNTTNQYMSGGNFDVTNGDLRLGFNIYRVLNYPF